MSVGTSKASVSVDAAEFLSRSPYLRRPLTAVSISALV